MTVWLILREGVAKSPCRCGSIAEIYTNGLSISYLLLRTSLALLTKKKSGLKVDDFSPDFQLVNSAHSTTLAWSFSHGVTGF